MKMEKKHPIKIVEIHLKRSNKNPKFCHAIAILFPCNHKVKLGMCKTPGNMGDRKFMRVTSVKIWEPTDYEVLDKVHCTDCPNTDYWVRNLPSMADLDSEHIDELEEE